MDKFYPYQGPFKKKKLLSQILSLFLTLSQNFNSIDQLERKILTFGQVSIFTPGQLCIPKKDRSLVINNFVMDKNRDLGTS